MARITKMQLDRKLQQLNKLLKRPTEPYTRTEDGLYPNSGHISFAEAYDGLRLEEMQENGGSKAIGIIGYISKNEMNIQLDGIIAGIRLAK